MSVDRLCISSLVVRSKPSMMATVRSSIEAIPEAEVCAQHEDGRLVVVLDTATNRLAADMITDIQNQPGILSATLIYQYDDQFKPQTEDTA